MFPIGFFLLIAGAWLADSVVHGRPPLQTLEQIFKDPGNMRAILDSSKGTATGVGIAGGSFDLSSVTGGFPGVVGGVPGGKGSGAGSAVVPFLEAQLGKPYKWGTAGPRTFDCSGLGYAAYRSIGVRIPRTTAGMLAGGRPVRKKNLQPGDAIFPYPGHVFWYVGSGLCVEAPHTGSVVHMTKIYQFMTARRFV